MVRECNLGGLVHPVPEAVGGRWEDEWVCSQKPPAPFEITAAERPSPPALLWPMAFHSHVITVPNSCRAKSHGLQ